jgi:hypothetical protein
MRFVIVMLALAGPVCAADLQSRDAYLHRQPNQWAFGSGVVEKTVRLDSGRLTMVSFRNKAARREYVQGGAISSEIRLGLDGRELTGRNGRWTLVRDEARTLPRGEVQLDLVLRNGPLEITKHYVAYPGAPLIREWLTVRNVSERSVLLSDPAFLEGHLLASDAEDLDLYYLTGGGNYNGSQLLKKEKMGPGYARVFDSKIGIQTLSYSAYLPLIALHHPATHDGVMLGWDYMGHWAVRVGNYGGGPVNLSIQVSGYSKDLAPGAEIETPKSFLGVFTGDLDAMGNSLLDWQYEYLWDLTNPDYFAKTRWAVDWPEPWIGAGGTPSADNWGRRLALDLRYVDLMRETGTDILWDDAGWYDRWGSWTGPEWRLTTDLLRKHGMRFALWLPTFLAHPLSKVAQIHPEWLIPGQQVLEQSIPATIDYQKALLDKGVSDWGDFQGTLMAVAVTFGEPGTGFQR